MLKVHKVFLYQQLYPRDVKELEFFQLRTNRKNLDKKLVYAGRSVVLRLLGARQIGIRRLNGESTAKQRIF